MENLHAEMNLSQEGIAFSQLLGAMNRCDVDEATSVLNNYYDGGGTGDIVNREVNGITPLLAVGRFNSYNAKQAVELLVDRGADINFVNAAGVTPLMHFAIIQKPDVIQFLLDRDVQVNVRDNSGKNALCHSLFSVGSSREREREVIALLCNKGEMVLDDTISAEVMHELSETANNFFEKALKKILKKAEESGTLQLHESAEDYGRGMFLAMKRIADNLNRYNRLRKYTDIALTENEQEEGGGIDIDKAFTYRVAAAAYYGVNMGVDSELGEEEVTDKSQKINSVIKALIEAMGTLDTVSEERRDVARAVGGEDDSIEERLRLIARNIATNIDADFSDGAAASGSTSESSCDDIMEILTKSRKIYVACKDYERLASTSVGLAGSGAGGPAATTPAPAPYNTSGFAAASQGQQRGGSS